MTAPQYIALIGDVVGSREVEHRQGLQDQVERLLREENRFRATGLASKLALTSGDEIQGLYRNPAEAIAFVERMKRKMHPIRMVFGIGRGAVSTNLDPDFPGRIDGPCFHNARDALREARDEQDGSLAFRGFGPGGFLLSNMADLIDFIERRWTDRQREFIKAIEEGVWALDGHGNSQRHVAAYFRVSPPVVSQSLKAAGYQRVKDAYTDMRLMAEAIYEGRLHWERKETDDA